MPEEPIDLSISPTPEGFSLRWNSPKLMNGFLTHYKITISTIRPHYMYRCDYKLITYSYETTDNMNYYNFNDGKHYFDYNCQVQAFTTIGAGKLSSIDGTTSPSSTLYKNYFSFAYKLINLFYFRIN